MIGYRPNPSTTGGSGTGTVGPRGPAGPKGDQGVPGAVGPQGPVGPDGAPGAAGAAGAAGQQGAQGVPGQAGGVGPKGDRGDQGPQGIAGAKGDTGERGPQGLPGADGAPGAKGDRGDAGAAGAQGLVGPKGDAGERGEQGIAGAKGDAGERGPAGADGAAGAKGDQGIPGLKGDRGDDGAPGAVGAKGDTGERGEQGLQGIPGDQGDAGAQGAKGDRGDAGIQGPKGDQGQPGVDGAPGAGMMIVGSLDDVSQLPASANAGESYLIDGHLHVWDGARWNDVGQIQGPAGVAGPKGDRGDDGAQGLVGPKGDKGDAGAAGPQGEQGVQGTVGAKGDQGDVGPQGAAGAAGVKGDTGAAGAKGDTGAKGDRGDEGPKGDAGAQGVQGLQGPKGDTGERGPEGAQGVQGLKGDTGDVGPKGDQGDVGPAGADGAVGAKGDRGDVGLPGAKGDPGDDFDGAARLAALEAVDTYALADAVAEAKGVATTGYELAGHLDFVTDTSVGGTVEFDVLTDYYVNTVHVSCEITAGMTAAQVAAAIDEDLLVTVSEYNAADRYITAVARGAKVRIWGSYGNAELTISNANATAQALGVADGIYAPVSLPGVAGEIAATANRITPLENTVLNGTPLGLEARIFYGNHYLSEGGTASFTLRFNGYYELPVEIPLSVGTVSSQTIVNALRALPDFATYASARTEPPPVFFPGMPPMSQPPEVVLTVASAYNSVELVNVAFTGADETGIISGNFYRDQIPPLTTRMSEVEGLLANAVSPSDFATLVGRVNTLEPDGPPAVPGGGARIYPSGVQNYALIDTWDAIRFDSVDRDTDGLWSASAPTRLTIPAGVSKIRLSASIQVAASDTVGANAFAFAKNGAVGATLGLGSMTLDAGGTSSPGGTLVSDVVDVAPGDFFEFFYRVTESFDASVAESRTWFGIEIVERDGSDPSFGFKVAFLSDVDALAPQTGDGLVYDAASKRWQAGVPVVAANVAQGLDKPFRGAMAAFANNAPAGAATTVFTWEKTDYDTDSFWSAAAPSEFVVPQGVKTIRLSACIVPTGDVPAGKRVFEFVKNGASFRGGCRSGRQDAGAVSGLISLCSPPIRVAAGDRFALREVVATSSAYFAAAAESFFALEVLESVQTV